MINLCNDKNTNQNRSHFDPLDRQMFKKQIIINLISNFISFSWTFDASLSDNSKLGIQSLWMSKCIPRALYWKANWGLYQEDASARQVPCARNPRSWYSDKYIYNYVVIWIQNAPKGSDIKGIVPYWWYQLKMVKLSWKNSAHGHGGDIFERYSGTKLSCFFVFPPPGCQEVSISFYHVI